MKKDRTLHVALQTNGQTGRLPMHMPGHKRNGAKAPYLTAFSLAEDITEIDGFDNLQSPRGILKESMEEAAALWGARCSFYLVNGSTGGILAAVRATTKRGDTVIMTRAAHASVYHAVELCGLVPVFLEPPLTDEGFVGSMPIEAAKAALAAHPEAKLVILTSPTYEGVLSDVAAFAKLAHRAGIPLLVDEAHGAHLSLSPAFPTGAIEAGADLVVQSLHKTLLSLTQTAILHLNGDLVDEKRIRHELSVFQSSSPSYLLLSSIDGCVRTMRSDPSVLSNWAAALARFDREIAPIRRLSVPFHDRKARPSGVFAYDPSKIYIRTRGTSHTGESLAAALRTAGIEPEMVAAEGVLAMTGAGDTEASLACLATALLEIDRGTAFAEKTPLPPEAFPKERALLPEEALRAPFATVPFAEAVGRICAEYMWAYPPGIPVVTPGEVLDEETALYLSAAARRTRFHSTRASEIGCVAVVSP